MNNEKKTVKILTVVIPTYNMERYLRRCLDSLIVSPELMDLLEVLVINDGSRDGSSAIGHEYEARYPGTFRVIDKENGNYGSCVNRGLDEATGKYLRLLDADDRFDTDCLVKFLGALQANDADMVVTNFCITYDADPKRRRYMPPTQNVEFGKVYPASAFDFLEKKCITNLAMHAITYRRAILQQVGLRHQTGISYTDTEFVYFPLVAVKTVLPLDLCLYLYTRDRDGQTMSPQARVRSVNHYYLVGRRIFDDYVACKENKADTALKEKQLIMVQRIILSYYNTVLVLLKPDPAEERRMRALRDDIEAYAPELLHRLRREHIRKVLYYFRLWECTGKHLTNQPYKAIYDFLTLLKRDKS